MTMPGLIRYSAALIRPRIGFFTAYSALTGYLVGSGSSVSVGISLFFGVFILAAGASALNQYQERDLDIRMERTKKRPLPSGLIRPVQALCFALMLMATGAALLWSGVGNVPAMLGGAAVLWYNGLYTPLKRFSAFAAVPGAIAGVLSPAIGWSSSGSGISDPRFLALCFLFFMWQVPHFWIRLLHHGEEYEHAGLPSLASILSSPAIARVTYIWISAAAVSGLLLPLYGAIHVRFLYFLLLPAAGSVIAAGFKLLDPARCSAAAMPVFRRINTYILLVMSVLSADSLLS